VNAHDDAEAPVPADHDAERAVLGAMLLDARCIGDVAAVAPPHTFHLPAHERIAEALVALNAEGLPTDPVSVHDHFLKRGQHALIGHAPYLAQLLAAACAIGSVTYEAHIVRRWYEKRYLVTVGTRLREMGLDPTTDLDDIPDLYAAAIKDLDAGLAETPGTNVPTAGDLFDATIDGIERPAPNRFIPTGINDLDALVGGWSPGEFIIVAARPSIGKSTLARGFVREATIRHGVPTLLASLEMSADENMRCIIAAEAKVGLHRINHNNLTDDDWASIARKQAGIVGAPLYLDETADVTLGQLRHAAHDIRRKHGLGLIVIDYLQLMTAPKAENRQQAVSSLSRGLKLLAKELGVPVIALSQLNRNAEARTDKCPAMSDLRESGSLEQDADVVILMHREDAYVSDSPRAGECDLIVAKNRTGPKATVTAAFQGHYSRVVDMAKPDWSPHSAMPEAA
jgi:replicative DNA helicase